MKVPPRLPPLTRKKNSNKNMINYAIKRTQLLKQNSKNKEKSICPLKISK